MILLAFLFVYDSLPPLPDLSRLYFPEPVLWVEPATRYITLDCYAGQFGGVRVDTRIPDLDISGALERTNEWDSTETGNGYISYSLRMPRVWFRPRFSGYLLTRRDDYQLLAPGFDFTLFSSFVLLASTVDYYQWKINGTKLKTGAYGFDDCLLGCWYLLCDWSSACYLGVYSQLALNWKNRRTTWPCKKKS